MRLMRGYQDGTTGSNPPSSSSSSTPLQSYRRDQDFSGVPLLRPRRNFLGDPSAGGAAAWTTSAFMAGLPAAEREACLSKVAAGKAVHILEKAEAWGRIGGATNSVYQAAIVLPQIARSSGWSATFTSLAIRSYFFLMINCVLQMFLLAKVGQEMVLIFPLKGLMHLCNFARDVGSCADWPDTPDCAGPGGTPFHDPGRLYDFRTWQNRRFWRDSLLKLFPGMATEIRTNVDPGEYGLEDPWCRIICAFVFTMMLMDDIRDTFGIARLLFNLPTEAGTWISYSVPSEEFPGKQSWANTLAYHGGASFKEYVKMSRGLSELDFVSFQVAGMPMLWKAVNVIVVLVPKFAIWASLSWNGTQYLMETAGIMDVVIGTLALSFITQIDEMVFSRLTTLATQHIMSRVSMGDFVDHGDEEVEDHETVLRRFDEEELNKRWRMLYLFIPRRLVAIIAAQAVFTVLYYLHCCESLDDGSWVSKAIYPPINLNPNFFSLMYDIDVRQSYGTPSWEMTTSP